MYASLLPGKSQHELVSKITLTYWHVVFIIPNRSINSVFGYRSMKLRASTLLSTVRLAFRRSYVLPDHEPAEGWIHARARQRRPKQASVVLVWQVARVPTANHIQPW